MDRADAARHCSSPSSHPHRSNGTPSPALPSSLVQYRCRLCGATFRLRAGLDAHARAAHPGCAACRVCDAPFGGLQSLHAHEVTCLAAAHRAAEQAPAAATEQLPAVAAAAAGTGTHGLSWKAPGGPPAGRAATTSTLSAAWSGGAASRVGGRADDDGRRRLPPSPLGRPSAAACPVCRLRLSSAVAVAAHVAAEHERMACPGCGVPVYGTVGLGAHAVATGCGAAEVDALDALVEASCMAVRELGRKGGTSRKDQDS